MNHHIRSGLLLLVCSLAAASVPAQSAAPAAQRPQGGAAPVPEALDAKQQAKVKSVLAAYRPNALTAEDAKLIKRTFRDAGIRRGPGLAEAMRAAGFSEERLEALDPSPAHPPRQGDTPPPGGGNPPAKK